ncbi:hypothetical protein [Frankia sp. Cas3]|uniref:hypothetical protein n=1 Tax=Frankia sp. Cas3 TaxID=3073926 RepID=UPI002AD36ACE|nr:hypothetical protein [Frankia sp. Cas3]
MSEPMIDRVYETTDEEDEYDRQCLDAALAEGGDPVPFRAFLTELGIDPDNLDDDQV